MRRWVAERLTKRTDQKKLETEFFRQNGMEWVNTNGRSTFFDIDHIVPVSLGGGLSGEDNLRVVCLCCHRKETAKLRIELKNRTKG